MPESASNWPKSLMSKVVWIVKPIRYADLAAFEVAVREYHMAIMKSDERWQPDARLLAAQQVEIGFECWVGDDQREVELELETADPNGWTTVELLFAIQNGIVEYLLANDGGLYDHCYFEGLSLGSNKAKPTRPSYYVCFGS